MEREPLIYHLDSRSHQSDNRGELPDEFFEITVDDVRKRFAQLKSERWESGGDQRWLMWVRGLGGYLFSAETRLDPMCSCTVCYR